MASDSIVPRPVVGLNVGSDIDFDSLVLGSEIRGNKYCKIYTVVASSWQTEPAEAHVFESNRKAQARFLNRSVWPKLRKSPGFKQEVKKDDGRTIFIISDRGSNIAKEAETPDLKPSRPDIATTSDAIPPVEHTASPSSALREIPTSFKPSAVGRSIFLRNFADFNGDEATPTFQSDGFPGINQQSTAEEMKHSEHAESRGCFKREEHLSGVEKLPTVRKIAEGIVLESWREQSDDRPKRRRARQVPEARNLQFILKLADEVAKESLDCDTDGVCQFGYRFMTEHLYPWKKQWLTSQALADQTSRQKAWSRHLDQIVQRLPGILKTQEAKAERTWLESLHELHRIMSDMMQGCQQTEKRTTQNVVVMRWIVERSFSGFGHEAAAMLSDSFDCDGCDGEPIMRWMLRIRSHVRMRKWAIEELSKAPDAPEKANSVLMRLIEAHTAHELVLGMKPIMERMHLVSQFELEYWEELTEALQGDDMKELDKISDRWRARRSILKPKKTE